MARRKLGLVGAGNIGTELANVAVTREVADVILYDIPAKEGLSRGKALDLEQMTALNGSYVRVWATSDFRELSESAVLIVTAGIPRKPGQSRDDLVATNLPIIRDVATKIREYCPNAFVSCGYGERIAALGSGSGQGVRSGTRASQFVRCVHPARRAHRGPCRRRHRRGRRAQA